jgi:hypothetical protein
MHPLESAPPSRVFRVTLRTGIWNVSRNDVFFGDYRTRGDAVRAAYAAARTEAGRGRLAQVFAPPGKVALSHHEPHRDA